MDARHHLNRIAASQHSLITLDEALQAGLTTAQVRRRTRSGEWEAVRPRVYAVGGASPSWLRAIAAASLSLQPGAWVSHRTAGRLWGFPGVAPEEIDILVESGRRVRMEGVVAHRSGALFTADLTCHRRIRVTSPERTLVDLSAVLPAPSLGRVLDDALRRRILRLEALRRCVRRLGKSPGRRPAVVHDLLAARLLGYDPVDSDLETRVRRVVVVAGLAAPVQQHRVRLPAGTFKIDLAYPRYKLAIELDGWEFHGTRSAFDADRARANALVLDGWMVLRFTSKSTDAEIVASIRRALVECGRSGAA